MTVCGVRLTQILPTLFPPTKTKTTNFDAVLCYFAYMPEFNEFAPLSERAVRRDGSISLKLIEPGWGSSGYYGRPVLERDIPRIFPAGTHMYWNHPTATEDMERPEGDLRNLAAVIISDPIFLENGPEGPGMYADSRPFSGYAETIDEIGEHIGVSIRGMGRHTTGEAEGKTGRIVTEIVAGKSVDFVTAPGAGGAIVQIFESAPGNGRLPDPTKTPEGIETFLAEAGRVLSKSNETKLKAALEQLTAVLSLLDSGGTNEAAHWLGRQIEEALSNNDLRDRLQDKLKNRFGGPERYIWPRDWSVDDGWVVFEISTEKNSATYQLDMTTTENDVLLSDDAPFEVRVQTKYVPVESTEMNEARDDVRAQTEMEVAMSEQELKEARGAQKEAERKLALQETELAKAREQLLLREAVDFVAAQLSGTELPDVTRARLAKTLPANPPIKEGVLDTAAFEATVKTAVAEAEAEIAALLGKTGKVTGNGASSQNGDDNQLPDLAESKKRADAALVSLGYGTLEEA